MMPNKNMMYLHIPNAKTVHILNFLFQLFFGQG